jgi:hypothetical protein
METGASIFYERCALSHDMTSTLVIQGLSPATFRDLTSLPAVSPAVAVAHFRLGPPLRNRPDARTRSAVALLPLVDGGWFGQSGTGTILLLVGLAAVAILALLVASAAHRIKHSKRDDSINDEELFTTTPLPLPKEELARMRANPPHRAHRTPTLPRWVQVGSVAVALGMTWYVAQRTGPSGRPKMAFSDSVRAIASRAGAADRSGPESDDSPEDLDLVPDSAPPFSFRAGDWITSGAGCAGRLVVTKGEPNAWMLTARVHNGVGQLLDTARARVTSLSAGDIVEFKFSRATCDQIGAWDVRGARPAQ